VGVRFPPRAPPQKIGFDSAGIFAEKVPLRRLVGLIFVLFCSGVLKAILYFKRSPVEGNQLSRPKGGRVLPMFSLPTLFIIGAGANAEFGMPTGADLKEQIAKDVDFRRGHDGLLIGDRGLYELLANRFRQSSDVYIAGAIELSQQIPQFPSIDEALHWFSGRSEIVTLGKVCIVRNILAAERRSRIANAKREPSASRTYPELWANEFLSMAVGSFKREQHAEIFAQVRLINFNYDRAVEHYLFNALGANFGLTEPEAVAAISGLKVIRPYGLVAALPWKDENGAIPFGADLGNDHERLFMASENIRTYTEQTGAHLQTDIREAVGQSHVIVILGFGFHQQNMAILNFEKPGMKRIYGTVLNIDRENYESLARNLTRIFRSVNQLAPQLLDRRCYKFLETMKLSILAAI
jgi:hypothetical protein